MGRKSLLKHVCKLPFGSDSMLPKKRGKLDFCRMLRKLTLIAVAHPSSWTQFISYPAIVGERQRQLIDGGAWVNHPYSLLSLIWGTWAMLLNFILIVIAPFRFAFILPTYPAQRVYLDYVLLCIQIMCILDIFFRLNTGYLSRIDSKIVMDRRRIAWHYCIRWFIIDVVTSIPVGFFAPDLNLGYRWQLFAYLIPCLRTTKICLFLRDIRVFLKIFRASYIFRRGFRHLILFTVSLHWCSCLLYFAPIFHFYWTGTKPVGYSKFLVKQNGDLTACDVFFRYQKSLFIACAAFFGTGYSMFRSDFSAEIVIDSCVILYGSIFMVYTLVLLLKIYMTKFNSTMRYQELMNQMEKYMRHKQFPVQMRNRVRDFYCYTYQENYYKEEVAQDCLSAQIRNEIFLDTCHRLIQKVPLLEGLPASVVGTVLGCLKPEVYMPNDLIVRAGDIGECMYFIATGTVAVNSSKGVEVCHLEDGQHFGEVALLMKDKKRVATVVAIEITQVYRLDAPEFNDFVMTYQELYERIEMLASKRMHETVLIDEIYKQHHPFGPTEKVE